MFRRFVRPLSRRGFSTLRDKKDSEIQVNTGFLITSLLITSSTILFFKNTPEVEKISWINFKKMINSDETKIKKIEIRDNNKAVVYSNDEKQYLLNISNGDSFEKKVENINSNIEIEHIHPSNLQVILSTLLPSLLFFGLFFAITRRQQGGLLNLFKNESKIIEEKTGVKLKDIAGLHKTKRDVLEFSEIIMNPEKYKEIGTKIPKGILMEGPPGTGKTMLAKAVADNYDSKFYLISGSEFIQPIIGTGSRKVKDLFETARANTPAIIFIDEIDAVGKSRNSGKSLGNDERDNILNSLLVEMDGFEDNEKLLIMGATNRADSLDSALLRPGRFDRVVNFGLPDLKEREEILSVYYDKYTIDNNLEKNHLIKKLGMLTYGFSGASISNLYNEASIMAIRDDNNFIKEKHFDKAIDYVMLGNEKENFMNEEEKYIVSYHEAGHALISSLLDNVPSPTKISIIPRSKGALGFSQSIPSYEKKLYNKEDMISQMMVLMGGRAAEEFKFNKITNGASDDINKINKLARDIVTVYGMSNIGLRNIENDTKNNLWQKESKILIEKVDEDISNIINETYKTTLELIRINSEFLEQIQKKLFDNETIYKNDLDKIFNIDEKSF